MIGLTTRSIRAAISRAARRVGAEAQISMLGEGSALGVIRVGPCTRESAHEMAEASGLPIADRSMEAQLASIILLRKTSPRVSTQAITESRFRDPKTGRFTLTKDAPSGPLYMEFARVEGHQSIYVLRHLNEIVWTTQSHLWATLIAAVVVDGDPWHVNVKGAISMKRPAPLAFGGRSLLSGAGVCGVDWRADSSCLYEFASREDARHWLKGWIGHSSPLSSLELDHWTSSYARRQRRTGERDARLASLMLRSRSNRK